MRQKPRTLTSLPALLPTVLLAASSSLLTGCGAGLQIAPSATTSSFSVQGTVYGGQQPIVNARVYAFQPGVGSYGAASVSSLTAPLPLDTIGRYATTDANGSFSINGDYGCQSGNPVYLYAKGGDAGGGTNTSIALLAPVGICSSISNTVKIAINEVSTVAMVYALSPYISGPTKIGTPSTAEGAGGFLNGFANISQLEDQASGAALTMTPIGKGLAPATTINTLADMLADCVNTNGALTQTVNNVSEPTACGTLFSAATSDGTTSGTQPTDTVTAMRNIARNPVANISTLMGLVTATPPFQPALAKTPNDLAVSIVYSNSEMGSPGIPAVDADGNVWVPSPGHHTVIKFSQQGVPLNTIVTPFASLQAAVDIYGNAWFSVLDAGYAVLENVPYKSNTQTYNGYAYNDPTGNAANGYQIAIDAGGDVYVSDHAEGRIYKVDPDGSMAASGFNNNTSGSCCGFTDVALESNGDYVTIQNGDILTQSDPNGTQIVYTGLDTGMPAGALDNPGALAVDSSAAIWAINADNVLSKFAGGSGSPDQGPGFTGGGLNSNTAAWPYVWLAIDGASSVWVPNYAGQSLSEFNNAGAAITNSTGIVGPTAGCSQKGLAIDMGGNVWVTCDSETAPVMEFLGLATPVYAPLYPGKFGVAP